VAVRAFDLEAPLFRDPTHGKRHTLRSQSSRIRTVRSDAERYAKLPEA
jgi:hypothetical protein